MDAFTWLDQFVGENLPDTADTSNYFSEEGLSDEISRIVQYVIDKINELILKFRAKYAQVKFVATVKKLSITADKNINCLTFLPSDVKRLLKKAVDNTGDHVIEIEKIYRKFVNGPTGASYYDKYRNDIDRNNKEFSKKMGDFTSEIKSSMKELSIKDNKKIIVLLTAYDTDVSNITSEYSKVGNEITKKLSTIKKTPATGKPPEIFYDATQLACTGISSIYAAFTSNLNAILDTLIEAGNNVITKVAESIK